MTCPCCRGVVDTGPYNTADLTFKAGLAHVPESEHLKDGQRMAARAMDEIKDSPKVLEARRQVARAIADPELAALMSDPVLSQVILDTYANPAAAAAHVKNPEVAAKVRRLFEAGLMPD